MPTHRFVRRVLAMLAALLFAAFLVLPSLGQVFDLTSKPSLAESGLASLPELKPDIPSLSRFFNVLRAGYLDKHFGFRGALITWYNYLTAVVLASSQAAAPVILGLDSWLFLAQDGAERNLIEDFRLGRKLPEDKMAAMARDLTARRDWLAERGIPYLVVVAPNKNTVYPEKLPPAYRPLGRDTYLDQMLDYLAAHTDLEIIDLRTVLAEAKKTDTIYYVTDSHWNAHGAFAAYRAIAEWLARRFPDMPVLSRQDVTPVTYRGLPGDLAFMMGLTEHLHEDRLLYSRGFRARGKPLPAPEDPRYFQPPVASEIPGSNLPRAVVLHDSFFWELLPFLAEQFSHAAYLWLFPQTASEPRHFDKAMIERERPDVVIEEFTERYFVPPLDQPKKKPQTAATAAK